MPPRGQPRGAPVRGRNAANAATAESPLRSLREVAACADELLGSVSARTRRLMLGLSSLADAPAKQAWGTVWSQPQLRIPVLSALGTTVRRLPDLLVQPDAEDDETFAAFAQCATSLTSGLFLALTGGTNPPLPADCVVVIARQASATDMLSAVSRLAATAAEAEVRAAQQRISLLRAACPPRALRVATSAAAARLSTRRVALVRDSTLLATSLVDFARREHQAAQSIELWDAVERSRALGTMARSLHRVAATHAEAAAAEEAVAAAGPGAATPAGSSGGGAAASVRSGGAGGSGGWSASGGTQPPVSRDRQLITSAILLLCKSVSGLWKLYIELAKAPAADVSAASTFAAAQQATDQLQHQHQHQMMMILLERLLFDPCVQHFVLQQVLAQVAAADGGSSYGLAPAQRLPALSTPHVHDLSHALGPSGPDNAGSSTAAGADVGKPAIQLLYSDLSLVAVEMWTLAGAPVTPSTTTGTVESSDANSVATQAAGQDLPAGWPPGAAWSPSSRMVTVGRPGGGGLSGQQLQRPALPAAGLEALLLRFVQTRLDSLIPGLQHTLSSRYARLGKTKAEETQAMAALVTLSSGAPAAIGGDRPGFPPHTSLVHAAKALLLAVTCREQLAQSKRLRRRQQQQQQEKEGTAAANAKPDIGADELGDVRALWQPLVRVTQACVDAAVVCGFDLGSLMFDGSKPAVGYVAAARAMPLVERLLSPCGGLRLPPLLGAHRELFTLLPAPLPGQAAALSSGYLPALERLLRALHRTRGSRREQCNPMLGGFGLFASHARSFEPMWAVAFAYGPPREVASLVATFAQVMRLMTLTGDGAVYHGKVDDTTDPAAPASAATVKCHTPGELAMRRGLLHGPNMLRGLLAWLADSTSAEPAAAAVATTAPANLTTGQCWWQRRRIRQLDSGPEAAARGSGSSGSERSGSSSGSGSCSGDRPGGTTADPLDWGMPAPAVQALALSSFTLRRWLLPMSRAAQHLCTQAYDAFKVAAGASPSDAVKRAVSVIPPVNAPGTWDDDLGHAGILGRAAAGTARLVFEAAVPVWHAYRRCQEFAEAARARACRDSRGPGVAAEAAKAVAAEAEAAAEAWQQLLLETVPPCIMAVTPLLAISTEAPGTRENAAWVVHALLQLTATWPEEAARQLGALSFPVMSATPVVTMRAHVTQAQAAMFSLVHPQEGREPNVVLVALEAARELLERGGRPTPCEREAVLAGRDVAVGWCAMGSRGSPAVRADWAARVGGLLPPPALATELLRLVPALDGCSNGACLAMPGDSAEGVPAWRCGGLCGGAAMYCCPQCQAEHWKAGHKHACGKK